MDFDYDYFTKKELVDFLNKHGNDFKYMLKPYEIMLRERTERKLREMEGLLKENDKLLEMIKDKNIPTGKEIDVSRALLKNHGRFDRLQKELEELREKAWAKE